MFSFTKCCLLPIVLLCVLTEMSALRNQGPQKVRRDGPGKCRDCNRIVEFVRSNSGSSTKSVEVFNPNSSERAPVWEVIMYEPKSVNFVQTGSPSLNRRIVEIAEDSEDVKNKILAAMRRGSESCDLKTNVPMSKAVVDQTTKLSSSDRVLLEYRTRNNREELYAEKRLRMTADLFGSICLGDEDEAMGTWMTSPRPTPDVTREQRVLTALENEIDQKIQACGLFVDKRRGYLAAVPDGLVGNNAIIKLHVLQRPAKDGSKYEWKIGDELSADKPLYYEVQGLLAITRKDKCHVIIVTRDSMQSLVVKKNPTFWKNNMLKKLDDFYLNRLLPRIANDQLPNISDIRLAASFVHIVTTTNVNFKEILAMTQEDAFDTLMTESKSRLLSKNFHIVMDTKKSPEMKVADILRGYYENEIEWEFERNLKMTFVRRFARKYNFEVEIGGLIIDPTNRFLASLPSAIGRRRVSRSLSRKSSASLSRQDSNKDTPSPTPKKTKSFGRKFRGSINRTVTRLTSMKFGRKPSRGPPPPPQEPPPTQFPTPNSPPTSPPAPNPNPDIIFEVVTPTAWFKDNKPPTSADMRDIPFMEVRETENGRGYALKRDSPYYYRIQGSLAISRVKTCVFIVGFPGDKYPHVEMIDFDERLWAGMLDKLTHFYYSSWLLHHACPDEYNRMFRKSSFEDLKGWPTNPPQEKDEMAA